MTNNASSPMPNAPTLAEAIGNDALRSRGVATADALMAVFGLTRADDPDRGPLPPGEPREDDGGEDSDGSDAPEWVGSDREGRG